MHHCLVQNWKLFGKLIRSDKIILNISIIEEYLGTKLNNKKIINKSFQIMEGSYLIYVYKKSGII